MVPAAHLHLSNSRQSGKIQATSTGTAAFGSPLGAPQFLLSCRLSMPVACACDRAAARWAGIGAHIASVRRSDHELCSAAYRWLLRGEGHLEPAAVNVEGESAVQGGIAR